MKPREVLRVLSLGDGVATGLEVLKRLGLRVEYHAIEICPVKRSIADANHAGIIRPENDLYEYAKRESVEYFDLVLCGSSCKSLSSQGKREEWSGESRVFFACVDILNMCKKTNPGVKFFFENVASMMLTAKFTMTELLGVAPAKICSGLVSIQDRERLYWFNWPLPEIYPREVLVADVLDDDGLCIFTVSKSNRNKKGEAPIIRGRMKANRCGTLVTGQGCRGQSTATMVITKKLGVRNLRPLECARIQGLGGYEWPCTDSQIFEAVGDGWQADIVQEILAGAFA